MLTTSLKRSEGHRPGHTDNILTDSRSIPQGVNLRVLNLTPKLVTLRGHHAHRKPTISFEVENTATRSKEFIRRWQFNTVRSQHSESTLYFPDQFAFIILTLEFSKSCHNIPLSKGDFLNERTPRAGGLDGRDYSVM